MERSNRAKMLSPQMKKGKGLSPEMKSFSESNLRETKSTPEFQRRCSTPDFHHFDEQNGIHDNEEMNKESMSSSIFGRMMSSFSKRSPRNNLKSSSRGPGDGHISHSSTNDEELIDATSDHPLLTAANEGGSDESLLLHFDGDPSCKESNTAKFMENQTRSASPIVSEPVILPVEDSTMHACPAVNIELYLIDSDPPPGSDPPPPATDLERLVNDESTTSSKEVLLPASLSSSVLLPEMYPQSDEQDTNYTPEEDLGLDMDTSIAGENYLLSTISPTLKEEVEALNPAVKAFDGDFAKVQAAATAIQEVEEVYAIDDPTDLLSELPTDLTTAASLAVAPLAAAPEVKQQVILIEDQTIVSTVKYHLKVLAYLSMVATLVVLIALLFGRYSHSNNEQMVVVKQPSKAVIPVEAASSCLMPVTPPITDIAMTKDINSNDTAENTHNDSTAVAGRDKVNDTVSKTQDGVQQESVVIEEDTTFEVLRQREEGKTFHQSQAQDETSGRVHPPAVINNKGKRDNLVMKVLKFPFILPNLLFEMISTVLRGLFSPFMGQKKKAAGGAKWNGIMPAARKKEDEQVLSPLPVELI